MKQLITLALMGLCSYATAQIIDIPDANFKYALVNTHCVFTDMIFDPDADADINDDGEIDINEAQAVTGLDLSGNGIASLDGIAYFSNLQMLYCDENQIQNLNLQGLTNLQVLGCAFNQMQFLNVQGLTNLKELYCYANLLQTLDVQGLVNLEYLACYTNQLQTLNLQGLTNLQELHCPYNQIQSLEVAGLSYLKELYCNENQIFTLNLEGLINVENIDCSYNQLQTLNVTGLTDLQGLNCSSNQLQNLELGNLPTLYYLYCYSNQLTTLNTEGLPLLYQFDCSDNHLISLFIKNGSIEDETIFNNNPDLQYICCDLPQIEAVQNKANLSGLPNCSVNSYCIFTPGGVFYTIQGDNIFDLGNNGCDVDDEALPNLKFNITSDAATGVMISNASGSYQIPVQEGVHTITPIIENPDFFIISPASTLVSFPTFASPFVQNFCITANGIHHDAEITIIPLDPPLPGFVSSYKLVIKNKGNQTENGTFSFTFDDSRMDFLSADQNLDAQNPGTLTWNYNDLQPFESRDITVVLYCYSPAENPPVNIGDLLEFTAEIQSDQLDETPADNIFVLQQTVVGSYDPNDKTCLEGDKITPEMVGAYVHYLIRFENTGTYPATNIVVKDIINTATFDISTLRITDASHDMVTRIVNNNEVEFIFEGIQLPFSEPESHGYIAFKIKTLPGLVIGDSLKNQAAIFFDYNLPVITNEAQTTVQEAVSIFDIPNRDVSQMPVFPNPVHDILHFQTTEIVKKIEVFDMLGRIRLSQEVAFNQASMETLTSGGYMLKIYVSDRVYYAKVVKE